MNAMRSVLRQLLFGVAPKGAALDTQRLGRSERLSVLLQVACLNSWTTQSRSAWLLGRRAAEQLTAQAALSQGTLTKV